MVGNSQDNGLGKPIKFIEKSTWVSDGEIRTPAQYKTNALSKAGLCVGVFSLLSTICYMLYKKLTVTVRYL